MLVSIIEDNKEYQQSLKTLIEGTDKFRVGYVFSSAEEIIPYISQLQGIVIVDIKLPGMNGPALILKIRQENSSVQCIVCSMYDDDEFIFSALKNGALGYLLKDSTGKQILEALDEIIKGGSPMSPYIARRVIASFQRTKGNPENELLSDRETEVLQQLSQGLIYKEIAEQLGISYETVKQHIKKIYQKLHVQNKIEALNKFHNR